MRKEEIIVIVFWSFADIIVILNIYTKYFLFAMGGFVGHGKIPINPIVSWKNKALTTPLLHHF